MTGSLPFFFISLSYTVDTALLQTVGLSGDVGRVTGSAHSSGQGSYDGTVSGPYVGDLLPRATAGTAQKADQALIIAEGFGIPVLQPSCQSMAYCWP